MVSTREEHHCAQIGYRIGYRAERHQPAGARAVRSPPDLSSNPAQNQIMADQIVAELPARLGW